jgi:hypothetical protein
MYIPMGISNIKTERYCINEKMKYVKGDLNATGLYTIATNIPLSLCVVRRYSIITDCVVAMYYRGIESARMRIGI